MSTSPPQKPVRSTPSPMGDQEHSITVLLIDDQPIIGEAVGRMLSSEKDSPIDRLLEHIHGIHGSENLEDDFSMVRIEL